MQEAHVRSGIGRKVAMAGGIVGISVGVVAAVSPYGAIVAVFDCSAALLIMVPAMLFGFATIGVTPLKQAPLRWRALVGVATGLGFLSLLALLFGLVGFLGRSTWVGILVAMFLVGILGLRVFFEEGATKDVGGGESFESSRYRLLWWLVIPFLTLALLAAAHPPGFIWAQEGFGYDVLEYHLQVPREYVDAGVISYLPHNVYANFPSATEMLYMVAMIVYGDVQDVGTIANLIHLLFGVLAVVAAWVTGREWSRLAGTVAGVAVATTGWLVYLSGLAYVENAVLFFGIAATGCLLRGMLGNLHKGDGEIGPTGWMIASGFCGGCACGCKYTGVVFVLAPLLVCVFLLGKATVAGRLRWCVVLFSSAMIPLGPWVIKNQVWTGNPFFPLANSVFEGSPEGWGAFESANWDRGHALKDADRSLDRRLSMVWSKTFADSGQRFGPLVLLVGMAGLFGRRLDRVDAVLLVFLAMQVLVWVFATHLFARFAVVLLIPLSLLLARSVRDASMRRGCLIVGLVVAGVMWNAFFAVRLYASETSGPAPASFIYDGDLAGYDYVGFVNAVLPSDAKTLLVGEAKAFYFKRAVGYCVTFNRNPFLTKLIEGGGGEGLREWIAGLGYTHVLVHYGELRRLSRTYGTSPPMASDVYASLPEVLRRAGFGLVRDFSSPKGSMPETYVAIYALTR